MKKIDWIIFFSVHIKANRKRNSVWVCPNIANAQKPGQRQKSNLSISVTVLSICSFFQTQEEGFITVNVRDPWLLFQYTSSYLAAVISSWEPKIREVFWHSSVPCLTPTEIMKARKENDLSLKSEQPFSCTLFWFIFSCICQSFFGDLQINILHFLLVQFVHRD